MSLDIVSYISWFANSTNSVDYILLYSQFCWLYVCFFSDIVLIVFVIGLDSIHDIFMHGCLMCVDIITDYFERKQIGHRTVSGKNEIEFVHLSRFSSYYIYTLMQISLKILLPIFKSFSNYFRNAVVWNIDNLIYQEWYMVSL